MGDLNQKINILFVIPSLVPGGAERVISFVSQKIDSEKFNTKLLVIGFERDNAYDVSGVEVIYLNKERVLYAIPSLISFLIINKQDLVMSSIGHLNTVIGLISPLFPKTRFIGREATVLSFRKSESKKRKWPSFLLRRGYKNLDGLICQSKDMAFDMEKNYGFPKNKIVTINNPISNLPPIKRGNNSKVFERRFITVGRMVEVKGHLRILEILAQLKTPYSYTIIGDGELKTEIFDKATELGILNNIEHIPFTKEVNQFLSESDLFLQGSYVEGFPNALLESCVVGVPAIAFDVPGGTKEILENDVNGYLVDSEKEFLEKIQLEREWVPEAIRLSVFKKFNEEKIMKEYEDFFVTIHAKNGRFQRKN